MRLPTYAQRLLQVCVFSVLAGSTSSLLASDYPSMRRAGINYVIAAIGMHELRLTECSFALKNGPTDPLDQVKGDFLSRLNDADRTELRGKMAALHPEMSTLFRQPIAMVKTPSDKRILCDGFAKEAIGKYEGARTRWNATK